MVEAKVPNYPYNLKKRYMPFGGNFVKSYFSPSDGQPFIAVLLSLDASTAIPARVLRLEASQRTAATPVRLPVQPGQIGLPGQTAWVTRSDQPVCSLLTLGLLTSVLWLNRETRWFCG